MEKETPQQLYRRLRKEADDDNLYFMRNSVNDGVMCDRNWNRQMTKKVIEETLSHKHPTDPCIWLSNTRKRLLLKMRLKQLEKELLEQKV